MGFSPVQYQTLIDKIEHGIADVESALNHAVATISADTSWIPGVGQAIGALLDKLVSLVQEFLREIVQLLKPFKVPLIMDQYGASWLSVHQQAGGVASAIESQVLLHDKDTWQGLAGGAYDQSIGLQAPAANTISSLANTTSGTCTAIRNFGYGFYIAVGAAVAGLIIALITIETVVGAIAAGLAALLAVGAALAALHFGIDAQTRNLQGEIAPNSTFPGGNWPPATTS